MNNTKTLIDSILETVRLADGPVSCQQVVDDLLKIGIRREKQLINVGLQKLITQGKIIRAREKSVENGPTLYQIAVDGVAVNPDPVPKFEGKIQKLPEKIEVAGVIPVAPVENVVYEVVDADFFPEPDEMAKQQAQPTEIDAVLAERGSRYGSFDGHAAISQQLKLAIRVALEARNKFLDDDQCEALDMICHKIGRIINGDQNYADSWIDIAGYAKLVADRLEAENGNTG